MKEFIQKYQKAIIGTGAVSVLLICYFQQKELSKLRKQIVFPISTPKIDSLQNVIDSLDNEIFVIKSINGRYELSLEHLYVVNPIAGKQFDDYLKNETE
jgi:hypothetical protein